MQSTLKFKLASVVSVASLFVAVTSTTACLIWFFEEPKMPKSLLKKV